MSSDASSSFLPVSPHIISQVPFVHCFVYALLSTSSRSSRCSSSWRFPVYNLFWNPSFRHSLHMSLPCELSVLYFIRYRYVLLAWFLWFTNLLLLLFMFLSQSMPFSAAMAFFPSRFRYFIAVSNSPHLWFLLLSNSSRLKYLNELQVQRRFPSGRCGLYPGLITSCLYDDTISLMWAKNDNVSQYSHRFYNKGHIFAGVQHALLYIDSQRHCCGGEIFEEWLETFKAGIVTAQNEERFVNRKLVLSLNVLKTTECLFSREWQLVKWRRVLVLGVFIDFWVKNKTKSVCKMLF